ncbi:MAG: TolC family protein [Candidatus Omnitrophica bacterium]|nr:TolC family protein [Candidatus Omnitrophota bacterium]
MKLLSKNKVRLLKFFYGHPEGQFYMQELGRRMGMKPGVFQRALNDLSEDGVLLSEYKANARFFRINKNYPVYNELKSIIMKAAKVSLIFLLFTTTLLYAAEEELTLKKAIIIAFAGNKNIQIQEEGIRVAKANMLEATSKFLPQVSLDASYTYNDKTPTQNIFFGFQNDNLLGLTFSESIYNGGANIANFRQAKINLKVAEETLRAGKMDVEFEAKRLYYGLLLAYENERIAGDLVGQARSHYLNVEDKFKHGTASRFDVLQSKVEAALLEPQLIQARNDIDFIKAELNKLFARKVGTPIEVKEKLTYQPRKIEEEEFLKTAYLNKPELILKALGVDLSKWSIQMAKSGYRPDINIQAGYAYRSNNTADMINGRHMNWNAGVSVTVPIFEGFSTKAKVDAAKAQYAQAALDKDNLSDQIAVDVRKDCLDLKQAEAIIFSQEENITEAREALRIAEVSYDNGVAINLDVLDAQVSLAQVQKNLAAGIYDYLMAEASLDRNMAVSAIKEEGNEKTKPK